MNKGAYACVAAEIRILNFLLFISGIYFFKIMKHNKSMKVSNFLKKRQPAESTEDDRKNAQEKVL
jgi:hypothetical protein